MDGRPSKHALIKRRQRGVPQQRRVAKVRAVVGGFVYTLQVGLMALREAAECWQHPDGRVEGAHRRPEHAIERHRAHVHIRKLVLPPDAVVGTAPGMN